MLSVVASSEISVNWLQVTGISSKRRPLLCFVNVLAHLCDFRSYSGHSSECKAVFTVDLPGSADRISATESSVLLTFLPYTAASNMTVTCPDPREEPHVHAAILASAGRGAHQGKCREPIVEI